jgi:hypothetical protein
MEDREAHTPNITPSRRGFVLILDSSMLVALVLLLSPRMTGLAVHESLGVAFSFLLLVHLLIAWPWISTTTKRVFVSVNRRVRVNYSLNTILFILIIIELVSGLVISQVVLPFAGIRTINDGSWRALHNLTLNWTMLAAGFHLAINWEWIRSALRQRSRAFRVDGVFLHLAPSLLHGLRRTALFFLCAGIVASGAYALLGRPSPGRVYVQDEIARFTPTFGHGIGQIAGETMMLGLIAYVGYRWLHMRL